MGTAKKWGTGKSTLIYRIIHSWKKFDKDSLPFFISTLQKLSPVYKILNVSCPKFIVKSLFLLRTVWVSVNKNRQDEEDTSKMFMNYLEIFFYQHLTEKKLWTILTSVDLKSFENLEWRRRHKSWNSFAFAWTPRGHTQPQNFTQYWLNIKSFCALNKSYLFTNSILPSKSRLANISWTTRLRNSCVLFKRNMNINMNRVDLVST